MSHVADLKSIGTMELFFSNVHCKHILFAGSADNSYTGFLRQFTSTGRVCQRLTLVESVSFPSGLAEIAPKFHNTRFDSVFRNVKIVTRRVSFNERNTILSPTLPTTYAARVSARGNIQDNAESSDSQETPSSQASLDLTSSSLSTLSSAPSASPASSAPASTSRNGGSTPSPTSRTRLQYNRRGYRIDSPVNPDLNLVKTLKTKKLCNRYYLSSCGYNPCSHSHDANLVPREMEALRYVARLSPCHNNVYCDDPDCVAGHRCIYDGRCIRGDECKFAPEMHNVDTQVVETTVV